MYVVPDTYMTAIQQPVQVSKMKGAISEVDEYGRFDDLVEFTDKDILSGTFILTNQCSDGNYVQIGTVYVGELTCTFIIDESDEHGLSSIGRNNWIGKVVKPVYQQQLGDNSFFDIKLGVFTITSAEWTSEGIAITAYDNMMKFDKDYPINNDTGGRATNTPWWWLNGMCYECKVELANTEEEISAFENGTEELTLFTTDNVYSFRDLLHWLSQAMGCFATIDRDGRLILKTYSRDPVDTIDSKHRFKGGQFAPYKTRYDGVELFDLIQGDWVSHGTYDSIYSLYDNPFLQTENSEDRSRWLSGIISALSNIDYVPFKVSMIGNPMYWLGDVIKFTEGLAGDESLCCITKFTFNYHKEYVMEGAGHNPNYVLKSGNNGMQKGYDSAPTQGSTRSVTSGGIYEALQNAGSGSGGDNGVGQKTDEGGEIFNHYPGDNTNIFYNKATANYAHAEGTQTTASGTGSHAEGYGAKAIGTASHAEGYATEASGGYSHAEGMRSQATSYYTHAGGWGTIADEPQMTAMGAYNKAHSNNNTYSTLLVVGNGMDGSRANAFRVDYIGHVYGKGSFNSSGADYAEYFEWLDGNPDNEDRVGYFVTLQDKMITKAKAGDYILGIVSGQPCIIGNSDEDWLGRWEHDEFNRFIMEEVDIPIVDEEGNETGEIIHTQRAKANPNYDSEREYIERKDRPEWDAVGMVGVLSVRDDGTCEVNGYAAVADDGTATRAEKYISGQTYRVVKRITNNVVEVIFR